MIKEKSKGLSTLPCGMPFSRRLVMDKVEPMRACKV